MGQHADNEHLSPLARFWRLLVPFRTQLRSIYAYAVLNGIINLSLPLGIQAIITYLQMGELTSNWVLFVFFVLVGIGLSGVVQVYQLRAVEDIQQRLFAASAFEFAYRLPRMHYLQLDSVHAPELANRFFDTLTLQKGLPKILIDFSLAAFQVFFGLVLLAIYSPIFLLLALALGILLWLIGYITGQKGLTTSIEESKYKYQLAHWLEEIARVHRSFKLNTRSDYHLHRTDDLASRYLVARQQHFGVLVQQFRLLVAFKVFLAASLLLMGGLLVFGEQMSIGQFVAAEIIIILIINSIEKILKVIDTIYDVLTALDKIGHVADLANDASLGTAEPKAQRGMQIEARQLTFRYPFARKAVLEACSFRVEAGACVRLAGEAGSGKSTLLHLLSGMLSATGGELLLDGIPLPNYRTEALYAQVGFVFAQNSLFEGSIRDNLRMGRSINPELEREVLQVLGLQAFLDAQPLGLDTQIDSGGRRLPRTVVQKLQIGRAVLGQPKLLLLEDPLQYLSQDEQLGIVRFLTQPGQPWTLVLVADDPIWAEHCTQTITL